MVNYYNNKNHGRCFKKKISNKVIKLMEGFFHMYLHRLRMYCKFYEAIRLFAASLIIHRLFHAKTNKKFKTSVYLCDYGSFSRPLYIFHNRIVLFSCYLFAKWFVWCYCCLCVFLLLTSVKPVSWKLSRDHANQRAILPCTGYWLTYQNGSNGIPGLVEGKTVCMKA